ncbi:MAG: hypothetical protein RBT59_00905 [Arcobacteraceae bacterium]|jgi:hypothetical protein|nr:hypothetical protein [Arcobacteraceae bacterium]
METIKNYLKTKILEIISKCFCKKENWLFSEVECEDLKDYYK